jgi:predicted nuclease of predicted toxin-antitoxin system
VHNVGLDRASDTEVWEYAVAHGYMIVSKDADFYQRSVVLGSPPKIVWLRVGNCTVAESADILRERYVEVVRFVEQSTADFLILA